MSESQRAVWAPLDMKKCPRCGCQVLTNGSVVWCSFVGGRNEKACAYGIDDRVSVEDHRGRTDATPSWCPFLREEQAKP